jgi:hypothetical protein
MRSSTNGVSQIPQRQSARAADPEAPLDRGAGRAPGVAEDDDLLLGQGRPPWAASAASRPSRAPRPCSGSIAISARPPTSSAGPNTTSWSCSPRFAISSCCTSGGYKRSRNTPSLANSDPAVVAMAAGWLRRLSGRVPSVRVQHHADQDIRVLRAFWAPTLPWSLATSGFTRRRTPASFEPGLGDAPTGSSRWRSTTRSYARACRLGWTGYSHAGSRLTTRTGRGAAW